MNGFLALLPYLLSGLALIAVLSLRVRFSIDLDVRAFLRRLRGKRKD